VARVSAGDGASEAPPAANDNAEATYRVRSQTVTLRAAQAATLAFAAIGRRSTLTHQESQ
jgi:hypothetical protein